jgi:REP element-mobilizing transposase RayT
MGRPLRIEMEDGVYHVTSRGLERRALVRDDADRERWLGLLGAVATRRRWRVFAWALMGNHFHLFLRTPDGDLSAGMHDLNAAYVTGFNRRHGRCGPLLQGRFKAVLVEREHHYWELSRYIHLNPVRARLVADPADYRWSSAADYLGRRRAPAWLAWEEILAEHGDTLRAARARYARFLAEGVAAAPPSPMRQAVAGTLLGSAGFVAHLRSWLRDRLPDRDVPAARALRQSVGVDAVEAAVCAAFGVPRESLRVRRRKGNVARAAALYLCRKLTGEALEALGARFGRITSQAVSKVVARLGDDLVANRPLARQIRHCEALAHGKLQVKT